MTTAGLGAPRGRALTMSPGWGRSSKWSVEDRHQQPRPCRALHPHPPHPEPALTSSVPQDRDPQAEPGAEQEASARLSNQNFALQGPTWKRLG